MLLLLSDYVVGFCCCCCCVLLRKMNMVFYYFLIENHIERRSRCCFVSVLVFCIGVYAYSDKLIHDNLCQQKNLNYSIRINVSEQNDSY